MLVELFTSAVTLAATPSTPMPGTQAFTKAEVPWPVGNGMLDFGVKTTSDSYTDGHFSITAPVFSNIGQGGTLGGSLLFIEPYISWGEQGEVATSLGLGFRHLFNSQSLRALQERHAGLFDEGIMVGGNLFLDMLDTQNDNRFWQLGFGLEFETRYFALRGNYYQPLTGRQEGEPILQRDIQRATLLTSGKEPFATGHTIQQDVTFTTYDFYTDRLYHYYEEGMKGWDVEAAVLVPGLDKWCELWLIAGYGDFQNKPFGPQIGGTGEMHGWKSGIEFRPIPQLVLSATHFDEKRMQGGEWMFGLSLQLPLDPEPGNKDKSWWKKLRDTLKPRSRHLAERAVVPVHRQNAAVKVANSVSEPEVNQYAKEVASEEKRVVLRDDVIFVNNGGAQGNGIAAHGSVEDGTAESPFDTIQEGVDLASTTAYQGRGVPTVYVAGGAVRYSESIITGSGILGPIQRGLHLVSGGFGIEAYAGMRFGLGPAAIIEHGLALSASELLSVNGFQIEDTVSLSAAEVLFRYNSVVIDSTAPNFLVNLEPAVQILARHVEFNGNIVRAPVAGLDVRAWDGANSSVVISGNSFWVGADDTFFNRGVSCDGFARATITSNYLEAIAGTPGQIVQTVPAFSITGEFAHGTDLEFGDNTVVARNMANGSGAIDKFAVMLISGRVHFNQKGGVQFDRFYFYSREPGSFAAWDCYGLIILEKSSFTGRYSVDGFVYDGLGIYPSMTFLIQFGQL